MKHEAGKLKNPVCRSSGRILQPVRLNVRGMLRVACILPVFVIWFPAAPAQGFLQSVSPGLEEKVYLQTDRDIYVAGETIQFRLTLLATRPSGPPLSRLAYILVRNSRGETMVGHTLSLEDHVALGSIRIPDTLGTGIFQLVAFTNWMRNAGEDWYFSRPVIVANRFDRTLMALMPAGTAMPDSSALFRPEPPERGKKKTSISVSAGSAVYGKRSKVDLYWKNEIPSDSLVSLSLSVVRGQAVINDFRRDERVYTLPAGAERKPPPVFSRETTGRVLTGRIIDPASRKGLQGARLLLSTPDSLPNFQYAFSGEDGSFRFLLNPFYDSKTIYLTVDPASCKGNPEIVPDEKFNLSGHWSPGFRGIDTYTRDYINKLQLMSGINRIYNIPLVDAPLEQVRECSFRPLLYSKTNYLIETALYFPLDNFHEIARELILPLRIRKTGEGYQAKLMNETEGVLFENQPYFFLDAVPVFRLDKLIPLGSEDLERVEVINLEWAHGELVLPGLVSLYSRNPGDHDFMDPGAGIKLENPPVMDYTPPVMPDYTSSKGSSTKMPDFRQVLCWEPLLATDKESSGEISFFTGDLSGPCLVTLEGITTEGEILRETIRITVE